MYQEFLTFIEKKKLLKSGDRVLIGVSGGVDSLVLLHLIIKAGFDVGVAHVNYHLRGEESDLDARLVSEACQGYKIPFYLHEVLEGMKSSSGSIQMIAREIRYQFFDELAEEHGYNRIATAHHVNDNLETVLFNFSKGTGISGLVGIAPKKGKRIRPLLFAKKEQIYTYASEMKLNWREDQSNQKSDYRRNLIRNQVIPILQDINPSLLDTFQDSLTRVQGVADLLNDRIAEIRSREMTTSEELEELQTRWVKDDPLSQTLLFEIMKPYEMNFRQTMDLWEAIIHKSVGAVFSTTGYDVNVDRDRLLIKKQQPNAVFSKEIQREDAYVEVGKLTFQLEHTKPGDISVNPDIACLDERNLRYPLLIRPWRQGDAFRPLGMTGKKKVSDFMIDSKIPVTLKNQVLIMESAGEIVWVVGLRIDDRFKVNSSTTSMLKIIKDHV